MSIELSLFDEVVEFGAPWHGLWRAGNITLPNGTSKAMGNPSGPGVALLRVPGQPAVSRTSQQLAADVAAGKEYRNYALLSGRTFAGMPITEAGLGPAYHMLIDDAHAVWLMRMRYQGGGRFKISVRRFGLFNGLVKPWSPDYLYQCQGSFWPAGAADYRAVGQSTTGRDWVIGNNVGDTPDTLIRFTCSGVVNEASPTLGLAITDVPLEWPGRPNHSEVHDYAVSGKLVVTDVNTWVADGMPDYIQTVVVTDGVVSGDDPPANAAYHNGGSERSYVCNKTVSESTTTTAEKIVWAAYFEDALILYRVSATSSVVTEWDTFVIKDALYNTTTLTGSQSNSTSLKSFGSSLLSDLTPPATVAGVEAPLTTNGNMQSWMVDGFVTHEVFPAPPLTLQGVLEFGQLAMENGDRRAIYLTAIGQAGDFFGQPLVAMVERYFSVSSAATTTTLLSIHAPSGVSLATAIPISNLSATWQPVTGEIVADTQPVCWM